MTPRSVEESLKSITRKCEQYWNEPLLEMQEFHAILEFIHREAAYAAQQVTQARKDLFQILVNRLSCDLAGLEEVPSDAAFVAMLDQLEFNARAERD